MTSTRPLTALRTLALATASFTVAPKLAHAGSGASAAGPADSATPMGFSELLLELGKAQQLADEDPSVGASRLAEVLEGLHAYPAQLARDEAAQAARLEGLLILARARMNLGDEAAASAALDEALRCAHGQNIGAARLGPSLARLEGQRREAIGDSGPLKVSCTVACSIYVDERETDPVSQLPGGPYRVTVRADEHEGVDPLVTTVEIDPDAGPVELHFGPTKAEPEGPQLQAQAAALESQRRERDARNARLLPRWAEISGLAVGVGAVATGAALVAVDGRCIGGGNVNGPNACDDLYSTKVSGYVVLGTGAAMAVAAAVLLGIDESRGRRAGRPKAQLLPNGLRF